MIKYFFSCIYGTIVLGEFIVQEIHFSLIEDDHIGKSTTKICHQIHLFWKQIFMTPPKVYSWDDANQGVTCTGHIAREWPSQIQTRVGKGMGTPDPLFLLHPIVRRAPSPPAVFPIFSCHATLDLSASQSQPQKLLSYF